MKTKEELNTITKEIEMLNKKLAELTEDELQQVVGGLHNMPEKKEDERYVMSFITPENHNQYEFHFYSVDKDPGNK